MDRRLPYVVVLTLTIHMIAYMANVRHVHRCAVKDISRRVQPDKKTVRSHSPLVEVERPNLPIEMIKRTAEPSRGQETEIPSSSIRNYKQYWDMYMDLKNYWLRVVSEMKHSSTNHFAMEEINEGYALLMEEVQTLMSETLLERDSSLTEMKDFIRSKIEELQNPRDCETARLLVCDVRSNCGFGCWVHIVLNCFLAAFKDKRTMIYKQNNFLYAKDGWNNTFLPLTNCTAENLRRPPSSITNPRALFKFPRANTIEPWLHWAIPTQLSPNLQNLHGNPFAWWISQFTAYTMRPNRDMEEMLANVSREINFKHPIAGIHVRRKDKIKYEARLFEVEEYMFFVEQWFNKIDLRSNKTLRTVYIATDERNVVRELKTKYPTYTFISNTMHAKARYTMEGLHEIVVDIFLLSRCDYLVCALTSSVCRTAYEQMTYGQTDASLNFQSLDIPYGFKMFPRKPYTAIASHSTTGKRAMQVQVGDDIEVPRDPFQTVNDGFLRGEHLKTRRFGQIPAYKVRPQVLLRNYSVLG